MELSSKWDNVGDICSSLHSVVDSNLGMALMKLQHLSKPQDFIIEGNSPSERLVLRPFRPSWWVDNDPITGNPIISAEEKTE